MAEFARSRLEGKTKKSSRPAAGWKSQSWQLLLLPFVLFITLPILSLFLHTSLADLLRDLNLDQVRQAIRVSLVTSFSSVGLTILFGTPVAYYLAHPQSRFHRLLDTLVDLPTILPPAVAGVALLLAFGRRGLVGAGLGAFGLGIPFTTLAVVLAQTFIASPFYIKSATLGFANVEEELKKAAALDGASRWQVFRFVLVPLSWTALLSGCVMTWARAMGEFGATIIFAGNFPGRTQTMPLAIYIGFEVDLNVAVTISVILILFSFITLILLKGFLPGRLESATEEVDY
jgi:molybdate transport system permease protein